MGDRGASSCLTLLALLFSVAACSRTSPTTDEQSPAESRLPPSDPASETPISPVERPPQEVQYSGADSGDIAAEVRQFVDLEACETQLGESVPPSIVDVFGDLGYRRVTTDACKTRLALASQEISACDELTVRATRDGCRRRYAMYHGEPSACPIEARHDGRDPTCVAVAMRDHSMCYAAESDHHVGICRSIILRNERPCRVAHEDLTAARRCSLVAQRWWNAMPPVSTKRRIPVEFEPSLTLCRRDETTAADAGPDAGGARCRGNPYLVRRGVVLLENSPVVIGARKGLPVGPRNPVVELRFPPPGAELPVEYDGSSSDVGVWIDLQGHPLHSAGRDAENVGIAIERFGSDRGSLISGTYRASLTAERGEILDLEGRFETFVRDLVESPEEPDAGTQ